MKTVTQTAQVAYNAIEFKDAFILLELMNELQKAIKIDENLVHTIELKNVKEIYQVLKNLGFVSLGE